MTLAVGLESARLLRQRGFDVLLTRDHDCTRALDNRTTHANKQNADLLVSIHANASSNKAIHGVQTFCIKPGLFAHGVSSLSEEEYAAVCYAHRTRCKQSNRLAELVHAHMLIHARTAHPEVHDRKIDHAVSQLLLGSHMPAALVEVGFLSHEQEAARLQLPSYRQALARGICNGIIAYCTQHG